MDQASDFDYLLSMPLWSLTMERVEELKREQAAKAQELETLQSTSVQTLWHVDLDRVQAALDEHEERLAEEEAKGSTIKAKVGGCPCLCCAQPALDAPLSQKGRRAPAKRATKRAVDDDDDEYMERKSATVRKPAAPATKKPTAATVCVIERSSCAASALFADYQTRAQRTAHSDEHGPGGHGKER